MKLSVIIISWNQQELLKKTLINLKSSKTDFEYDVYVVDNNSEDDSVKMVEEDFKDVYLIDNEVNFGYGRACNQVIKQLESDYVVIINPGTRFKADSLNDLYKWMNKNKQASVVGGCLYDSKGEKVDYATRFPKWYDLFLRVFKGPNTCSYKKFDYEKDSKIDMLESGFFAINLKNIADLKMYLDRTLPEFDGSFFRYFDRLDYCRQVYKSGGEVWYTPSVECIDELQKNSTKVQFQKYYSDSMLKYVGKWHSTFLRMVLRLLWFFKKIILKLNK